jgi:CheY-like chemotaxis protein
MTVILTVEDEFLTSEYLSGILEDAGYEVLGTSNADEAIAILEARNEAKARRGCEGEVAGHQIHRYDRETQTQ